MGRRGEAGWRVDRGMQWLAVTGGRGISLGVGDSATDGRQRTLLASAEQRVSSLMIVLRLCIPRHTAVPGRGMGRERKPSVILL